MDPNPYAPSAVVDPRQEYAAAGVGVWRDGPLIVMHRRAALPPRCILTGGAAVFHVDATMRWLQNLIPQYTLIRVPLSWHGASLRIAYPLGMFLAFLAGTLVIFWMLTWFANPPFFLVAGPAVLALTTIAYGLYSLGTLGRLLTVNRAVGSYLWLAGASDKFLESLPVWPNHR